MRVVSGLAGGIPLVCPKTGDVRPTMDQVRGAIFSSLAARLDGARVLDLFAGAGSLGIEALSRGAASAVFVERDRRAVGCIRRNLEKTRLENNAQVICLEAFEYLERRVSESSAFDVIFADPPYTTAEQPVDFASRLLGSEALVAALAPDGLFVLEKSPRHRLTEGQPWRTIRQKRYGTTEVLFLEPGAPAPIPSSTDDHPEPER